MIWIPLFALQVYFKIPENNERLHYVFYGIVMDYTVYYNTSRAYCPMMWFFINQLNLLVRPHQLRTVHMFLMLRVIVKSNIVKEELKNYVLDPKTSIKKDLGGRAVILEKHQVKPGCEIHYIINTFER